MVGLDHGPASSGKHDAPEVAARNARIGLVLFFVYVALYAGFVACAVAGTLATPIAGTNLAVWYGFGLIVAAFVMALLYGALCRSGGASDVDGSPSAAKQETFGPGSGGVGRPAPSASAGSASVESEDAK